MAMLNRSRMALAIDYSIFSFFSFSCFASICAESDAIIFNFSTENMHGGKLERMMIIISRIYMQFLYDQERQQTIFIRELEAEWRWIVDEFC